MAAIMAAMAAIELLKPCITMIHAIAATLAAWPQSWPQWPQSIWLLLILQLSFEFIVSDEFALAKSLKVLTSQAFINVC